MGNLTRKGKPKQRTLAEAPQTHIYSTGDFQLAVTVESEEVWLSQKELADLFGVEQHTISYHVKKVIEENKFNDSVIREIRYTAPDAKNYTIKQYSLDVIIAVGYRVGSPQATVFRRWANNVLKQYILTGMAINEKKFGSKSVIRMGNDLALLEKYGYSNRPEIQRLSRIYDNKLGAELVFAMIADVCLNPDYNAIKGLEYKTLFGMWSKDLKALLGSDKIRESLPDVQLQAFTLAELTLRQVLSTQKNMTNEQVLEAVRITFAPIGAYLRGFADMMGVHVVTGQPLLSNQN